MCISHRHNYILYLHPTRTRTAPLDLPIRAAKQLHVPQRVTRLWAYFGQFITDEAHALYALREPLLVVVVAVIWVWRAPVASDIAVRRGAAMDLRGAVEVEHGHAPVIEEAH